MNRTKLIGLACSSCFAFHALAAEQSPVPMKDVAQIKSTIEAIGVFADFGAFEAMCQLYDDQSTADYTSLWGTEPRTGAPSDMSTGWSGFIPGFDATRHDITVDDVVVDGDNANATARVAAHHWLGDVVWSISGVYTVALRKQENRWLIADWVFTLESETGDRGLVDKAEAIAVDLIERPITCADE